MFKQRCPKFLYVITKIIQSESLSSKQNNVKLNSIKNLLVVIPDCHLNSMLLYNTCLRFTIPMTNEVREFQETFNCLSFLTFTVSQKHLRQMFQNLCKAKCSQ